MLPPEVMHGPPLGACAVQDPRLDVLLRRLKWAVLLYNTPGLVGTAHRALATSSDTGWHEPSAALAAAMDEVHWKAERNFHSVLAQNWPHLDSEPRYSGAVLFEPSDEPAPADTVWTDGSMAAAGGSAAFQVDGGQAVLCHVPAPRSSTHCELVALCLVATFPKAPPLVLTDSLCALQLIRAWGSRTTKAVLACRERQEVRQFLAQWAHRSSPPQLEKVKGHDAAAQRAGLLKAVGNAKVDLLAKEAARGAALACVADQRFADAVLLKDSSGAVVADVGLAAAETWWDRQRRAGTLRRPWLAQLYPDGTPINWKASCAVFQPPTVQSGTFIYVAPPATQKWVARARAGWPL